MQFSFLSKKRTPQLTRDSVIRKNSFLFVYVIQINEHGHRSPSIPREKPPGVRRAMIVGGSHPMGMYVEARAMYAQALQRRLDATGARWQVINAAVSGHTTHQGLKVIEHHAAPFDPDVVIFDLGVNDNLPLAMDYAVPDHELAAAPSWATAGADVAGRFAAGRLAKRMLAAARRPAEGAIRVPRERGMQNAGALKALGAERGFEVLFLQQVMLEDMPGEGRGDEAGHIVCTREYPGLEPRVNLCDVFATFGRGAERYFVDTMHANEAGHAVIADAVFAAFEAQGWTAP